MAVESNLDGIIADLVLKRGLAKAEQVREAMALADSRGGALADALVELGYLTDIEVHDLLGGRDSGKPITIGGFDIVEKVGQGGMGAVYRARQTSLERDVALKLLPRSLASDPEYIGRFMREARASAKLNHLNIVQGIDVGEADGYYYFAMEFVDGDAVSRRLQRGGTIPEDEAIDIVTQIAKALEHASANGLVHRDVKPDNIMLDRHGTAKLCDLGLVTVPDEETSKAGVAIGTPNYISPEQARGEEDIDIRADIYGLGASAYHMLSGRTMFSGSAQDVLAKHVSDQAPSPKEIVAEVSEQVCFVLEKMLAKRRGDRYQSPQELIQDLDRLASGAPVLSGRFTARSSVEPAPRTVDTAAIGRRITARRPSVRRSEAAIPIVRRSAGIYIAAGFGVALAVAAILILSLGGPALKPGDPASAPGPTAPKVGTVPNAAPHLPPPATDPAKDMFEYVRRFEAERPDAIPESVAKYREVASNYPDSPWGRQAAKRAAELEKSVGDALTGALAKAEALVKEDKFSEAIAAYDDAFQRFGGKELSARVGRLKEQAELRAVERLTSVAMRAFEQANGKGDFDGAEAMLLTARKWGVARVDAKVDERLRELEALKAKLEREADEKAERRGKELAQRRLEAFRKLMSESRAHVAAHRYAEAVASLNRLLADGDLADHHAAASARLERVSAIADLVARSRDGIAKIPVGTKIEIRGRRGILFKGTVAAASDGRMTVRGRSGASLAFGPHDLAPEDMAAVGAACAKKGDASRLHLGAALMLAEFGETERARKMLSVALAARPPAPVATRLRVLADELADKEAAGLEAESEALLGKLRDCIKKKDRDGALSAYRTLKSRYSKSKAVSAAAAEIEKLAQDARAISAAKVPSTKPSSHDGSDPAKLAKAAKELVLRKVTVLNLARTLRNSGERWEYAKFLSDIGQLAQSIQEIEKLLKNPRDDWAVEHGRAHWQLCRNYTMLGRPDVGAKMYEKAMENADEDWFVEELEGAKDWVEKYPEHLKKLDSLYAQRAAKATAELQWEICDMLEAAAPRPLDERAELEAMVKRFPDHEEVRSGEAHHRLIERMESFREQGEIIKIAPVHLKEHPEHWSVKNGETDWKLAEAYRSLGMHQEALKHYKNIMREHKDHWSMARENGSPIQDRIRECNRRLR